VKAVGAVVVLALVGALALSSVIDYAVPWPLAARIGAAAALLIPLGVLLGAPLPAGMRLLAAARPELIPWGWGLNGALSVVGATLAVFVAMNWGFSATLTTGALCYGCALVALLKP
jgi:hypothetical protein